MEGVLAKSDELRDSSPASLLLAYRHLALRRLGRQEEAQAAYDQMLRVYEEEGERDGTAKAAEVIFCRTARRVRRDVVVFIGGSPLSVGRPQTVMLAVTSAIGRSGPLARPAA